MADDNLETHDLTPSPSIVSKRGGFAGRVTTSGTPEQE